MVAPVNYTIGLQAQLGISTTALVAGQCAVTDGSYWYPATAAYLAANPGALVICCLQTVQPGQQFTYLSIGIIPSAIFSLGPGAAEYAGLSSLGIIVRSASITGAVGFVDSTGLVSFYGPEFLANSGAGAITSLTGP